MAVVTFHLHRACRTKNRGLQMNVVIEVHRARIAAGSHRGELRVVTIESGDVWIKADDTVV